MSFLCVSCVRRLHFPSPHPCREIQSLGVARERLTAAQSAAWSAFLAAFAPTYPRALEAVRAAAQLDVLAALAALASSPDYCRPVFLPEEGEEEAQEGGLQPMKQEGPGACDATDGHPGILSLPKSGAVLLARDARHPMLDARLRGALASGDRGCASGSSAAAVPNDVLLDARGGGTRCLIVTGPNMGGKSCYTRTAALLVVMAQVCVCVWI